MFIGGVDVIEYWYLNGTLLNLCGIYVHLSLDPNLKL